MDPAAAVAPPNPAVPPVPMPQVNPNAEAKKDEVKGELHVHFAPQDLDTILWLVELCWQSGQVQGTDHAAHILGLAARVRKAVAILKTPPEGAPAPAPGRGPQRSDK